MYSFTRFLAIISLIGMLSATDEMKLMLINGRVVGESLDEGIENVWCKETCYNLPNCILAFMDSHNHCILFDFNSTIQLEVEETQKTDGFVVAFKTWLPSDSCPIYSEMIPVVKIGEDTIPWTKGIIVCMKPFLNSTLYNIGLARSYCENLGYKLSGLATVAEVEWVLSRLYALRPISKDFDGLWIDGLRNCTQFCDDFIYTDGYTVTGNMSSNLFNRATFSYYVGNYWEQCLQASRVKAALLNDVRCDWSQTGYGAVCGYQVV